MADAAPRQTQRFERKREAILHAAARLFNEKGLKGATLAEVAASVGLITTSVTYYFKKKDALAAACIGRTLDTLSAIADEAAAQPQAESRLKRFLELYLDQLARITRGEEPELINFHDLLALTGPQADEAQAGFTALFRKLRRIFFETGEIELSRPAANARTHLVLSVMLWSRTWVRSQYEPEDYARAAERIGAILAGGLAGEDARWAPAALAAERLAPPAPADRARENFLKAATHLVNEQGYHGASVDRISAHLSLTKGSFYHHNDTKDGLVEACFERSFEIMRQFQIEARAHSARGWDQICSASAALVVHQLSDHGPLLRYTALSAVPADMRRDLMATMRRLSERFAGMIADGIADGSIRPVDPVIAAQLVIGMINAASQLHRWGPGVTAQNAGEFYVRPLFTGVFNP